MHPIATEPRIAGLLAEIRREFQGADVAVEWFPSGAFIVDVRSRGRLFELTYSPSHGFGIDEISADDGFNSGYAFAATSLEAAADILMNLLARAMADA